MLSGERKRGNKRNNFILLQYAVLELPVHNEVESNVYAVPACTAWLKNIKMHAKDGKQVTFATLCKWPPDESKLSDYLEKKKKPTDTWVTFKNVKILKFCSKYFIYILTLCIIIIVSNLLALLFFS